MGSAPPRPKVLLLGTIDHAHSAWSSLSTLADLITPTSTSRSAFIAEAQSGAFDNVVAVYRTFPSVSITGLWDAELIASLPLSLHFVAHNGAGYDQIDVAACSARKPPIYVSNVPSLVDDATADAAVFLILGALRGFNYSMGSLRKGEWRGREVMTQLGRDPRGKVLGILGMGGIGRNMKRKTDALGMKAIYHNRNRLSEEQEDGAEYVGFEELLERSDVLSLNLPLNEHTKHIISTPEFAKMKKGVVIINTARGAVMDEDALVQALASGQVGSAGLDVYENEPKIHPGLVENPYVMLLPHMGTWTQETQLEMEEFVIGNIKSALTEGKLVSLVPEQMGL